MNRSLARDRHACLSLPISRSSRRWRGAGSVPSPAGYHDAAIQRQPPVADQDFTIGEEFKGTRFILEGRYAFLRGPADNPGKNLTWPSGPDTPPSQRLMGIVGGQAQAGTGDAGFDYAFIRATPVAFQRDREALRGFSVIRDTWEWGALQTGFDDALGVDSYTELTIGAFGRTWAYKRKVDSPWSFQLGLKVSAGWAWAESITPEYGDVSNPFGGGYTWLSVKHRRFGELYTDDNVAAGFTAGSPATGESISRAAQIRVGYRNKVYRCLTVDLFFEKRSFNFSDHRLADLYTKAKRSGLEVGCAF